MPAPDELRRLRDENEALRRRVREQERRIAELERRDARNQELIRKLLERIEELERAGKRQAAPFSKGEPKADPKPPGRKPGDEYGTHVRGAVPREVNETVPVHLPQSCPHCGGAVEEGSVEHQYQTEIPEARPFVRRFDIHIGRCKCCGKRVQPRHPLQTSDALGAAAVQWGPNLIALATHLNKHGGMSWEKIADFFVSAFHLTVARSTLCRAMMRLAGKLRQTYDAMVAALPDQPVVHPDETGYRENGRRMWLWAFVTANFTAYVLAKSRGSDVVIAVLTARFGGIVGRDGWAAYGCLTAAIHQTCLQHLLRRCDDILEIAAGRARDFPQQVKTFLHDALALRDRREELTEVGFDRERDRMEARLDELTSRGPTWNPNRKLAQHLARERSAVLTFLYFAAVEATNWPAEHAMRFAVMLRKVCGGTRSPAGSRAHETLLSIERTAAQQGHNVLGIYLDAQHSREPLRRHLTGPPLPDFDRIEHRLFARAAATARSCAR